jgi:hypothetical protein
MIEKIDYVVFVVFMHGQLLSRSDHSFGFKCFSLLFEPLYAKMFTPQAKMQR